MNMVRNSQQVFFNISTASTTRHISPSLHRFYYLYSADVKVEEKRSKLNLARLESPGMVRPYQPPAGDLHFPPSFPAEHIILPCSAFSLPMEGNMCFWTLYIFQSDRICWNILLTPLFLCHLPVIP